MRFCSQKVLEYLKNPRDNLVATMRNWPYRVNQRVTLRDCNGVVLGYGVIVDVAPPSNDSLKRWLPYIIGTFPRFGPSLANIKIKFQWLFHFEYFGF